MSRGISIEDLLAWIIRVRSEMKPLFLTTKSVSWEKVSRGSPLPSTVNSNGPTCSLSWPRPLELERTRLGPTVGVRLHLKDFTAVRRFLRWSTHGLFVFLMWGGWVGRRVDERKVVRC